MSIIRLTKEFSFEMAHTLTGYAGACSQIHGHSYRLSVTVSGSPEGDPLSPHYGMVMDFGLLKAVVNRNVVERYDHSLVIRSMPENEALIGALRERFGRILTVDYQPTCENMLVSFAEAIRADLPKGVELHSLRLHETANSFAEWFAQDNL